MLKYIQNECNNKYGFGRCNAIKFLETVRVKKKYMHNNNNNKNRKKIVGELQQQLIIPTTSSLQGFCFSILQQILK